MAHPVPVSPIALTGIEPCFDSSSWRPDLTCYREVKGRYWRPDPLSPPCRVRQLPRIGFVGSTGLRFAQDRRRTADRAALSAIYWTSNADGRRSTNVQQHTERAAAMLAPAATTARTASARPRQPCSTRRACLPTMWKLNSPRRGESPSRRRTSLARVTKTRSQVAITVRPIMPNACVCAALSDRLVSLREGASAVSLRRSAA